MWDGNRAVNLNAGKEVETEDRGIPKKTPNTIGFRV